MSKQEMKPTRRIDPVIEAILAQKPDASVSDAQAELNWKRELLARVQVLRSSNRNGINDIRNSNPAYAYNWVYNHPQRVQEFEAMFYEVVTKENDRVETNFERGGRHIKGDSILMRAPRDLVEAYNADRDLKAIEALEDKYSGIQEFGENQKIPFFRK